MLRFASTAILCFFLLLKPAHALAGDFVEDNGSPSTSEGSESTFDPFSDYSEFEEGSEEEADINFFHNGRFFSIGILGGYESFTDTLGVIYTPSFQFGLFLEYFFDLKLAMQLAYLTSTHSLTIATGQGSALTGSVALSHFEFDLKYYLNTQNVTRGLASLNPYIIFGASSYTRATNINGSNGEIDDSAFGAQAGMGIEIPIMHNSAFFGVQGTFNYIAFPNANTPITINGVPQGITPNGDAIQILGILGCSF